MMTKTEWWIEFDAYGEGTLKIGPFASQKASSDWADTQKWANGCNLRTVRVIVEEQP
jgi:hypothetical protein